MATQDVRLYSTGLDGANDVRLYDVTRSVDSPQNDVWLYSTGLDGVNDVRLYPYQFDASPGGFPTQYLGLKAYYHAAVQDLCLVAEADAPAGMGGVIKISKGGSLYAVYLVETTDPDASPVRVQTSAGTKAIREYT